MCSIICGWLKETFWQYVTIFMGYNTIQCYDKYNAMSRNVKKALHQTKAHTKIS